MNGESSDSPQARLIKRYANRKLYDTRDSRYVTLKEIAGLVQQGEEVRIVDNRTKEDLTNVTLAQIIYEQERDGDDPRSIRSLREFVREGRSRIQEGRDKLLESLQRGPMGKFVNRPERSEDEAGEPHERDFDSIRTVLSHPKEAFEELQRVADDRVKALVGTASGYVQQLQGEVRRLQDRIEELEGRLSSLTRRARRSEESDFPSGSGRGESRTAESRTAESRAAESRMGGSVGVDGEASSNAPARSDGNATPGDDDRS